MSREINLISEKKILSPTEERLVFMLQKTMPYILSVFVVIIAAVTGVSFYINYRISKLDQAILSERDQIKTLEKNESQYLLLKQKATVLTKILGNQFPYREFFTYLKSLTGPQVTMDSLDFAANGELVLGVTVANTEALDTFVSALLTQAPDRFRQIELTSVAHQEGNKFTIQLDLSTLGKS